MYPVSGKARNSGIGYSLLGMGNGRLALGGWANLLPEEVGTFLGTEALQLVVSGRLVVVPAPLVGCTQSVIGWTDNLLVNGLLGGSVMCASRSAQRKETSSSEVASRVRGLGMVQLPVIEGVPLDTFGTILDETAEWQMPLRRLLRRALGSDDMRQERWGRLGPEISDLRDALRQLDEKWSSVVRAVSDSRVVRLTGAITAVEKPSDSPGMEPLTSFARAIAGGSQDLGPWVPFWLLQRVGATVNWAHPLDNQREPAPRVIVNAGPGFDPNWEGWLYPGEGGPGIRASVRIPWAD